MAFGKGMVNRDFLEYSGILRNASALGKALFMLIKSSFMIFPFVLALALANGCSGKRADNSRHPVLLFAVDGMEWRVLKPLLAKGKLPAIAGIMEKGTYGYLETMEPTFSAVIWTTIATGKIPKKHGIMNFVYKVQGNKPGKSAFRYYKSGHRRTKAFWNILSDYGLIIHCIGWWITFPAEPVNGIMVSQTNTLGVLENPQQGMMKGALLKGIKDQVYPPEEQQRVMGFLEQVDDELPKITEKIFGKFKNPFTDFSKMMWDQTQWAFRADATYIRVAEDILERKEKFDLLALYIGATDVAAHRFWRYAYPEEFENPPPQDQIENFKSLIDDEYIYVDSVIGKLISLAPKDVTVIIISDHGMHASNTERVFKVDDGPGFRVSGNHLDATPGVFIASGGYIKHIPSSIKDFNLEQPPTVGSVLDITPTLLAIFGVPIGRDMYGSSLREVINAELLGKKGMRFVDTHDTQEWLASQDKRIIEAVDEEERIEELRSLGYIK